MLLHVHMRLLVLLPYRINLMPGYGLFTSAEQVCQPFDRNFYVHVGLRTCTHAHIYT